MGTGGTSFGNLPAKAVKPSVHRLSGLDYFPREPEAISALADILASRCTDENHVKAVVAAWLEEHTTAPKPAELIPLIERLAPEAPKRADPNCPQCSGSGYFQAQRIIAVRVVGEQNYLFAEKCDCSGARRETA